MQYLDLQVVEQTLKWLRRGEPVWLCTVLTTFGSSPREPGSLLAALRDGCCIGSLSGGCVEEDFLSRLREGAFARKVSTVRYGGSTDSAGVSLPCGGSLEVLVEQLQPNDYYTQHIEHLYAILLGQESVIRQVMLDQGEVLFVEAKSQGPKVERIESSNCVRVRVGPVLRLLIAGVSPVSVACADFARALGFEVVVCDPSEQAQAEFRVSGISVNPILPARYIASGGCHAATAVVALTHDPRLDDLTMMEAVLTPAFYIGVMGSRRTSEQRAERLQRIGGLSREQIARLHMPIGLNLGSKTPAEIALAVMADILRCHRGRARDVL